MSFLLIQKLVHTANERKTNMEGHRSHNEERKDGSELVMVASFLDRQKEGGVEGKLPAHLTYLPWFSIQPSRIGEFYELIQEVTEQERAPVIRGTSTRLFNDKDGLIEVRHIDQWSKGFNMLQDHMAHNMLLEFALLEENNGLDRRYTESAWSPHVTNTTERSLMAGEDVELDNLTVIKKVMGQKVIDRVFNWNNNPAAEV